LYPVALPSRYARRGAEPSHLRADVADDGVRNLERERRERRDVVAPELRASGEERHRGAVLRVDDTEVAVLARGRERVLEPPHRGREPIGLPRLDRVRDVALQHARGRPSRVLPLVHPVPVPVPIVEGGPVPVLHRVVHSGPSGRLNYERHQISDPASPLQI
jgi:hypothetical protein